MGNGSRETRPSKRADAAEPQASGAAGARKGPSAGTTGEVEALSLWAGQSVALAKRPQPAAEIVAELISHL